MDIKHLQYFIEVAKANSFSKAADNLFITQPTISKMIKNLERELGVTLFDRSKKNLVLTDAGSIILEQAKLIDGGFHSLESAIDDLIKLKKGQIRIGLPPIFDANFFPELFGRFHEKYPDVTFQLLEKGSKKIEDDVENNILDIGVIVLPTNNEIFRHLPFLEEDLMLIIPPSHSLADKEQIDLIELRDEDLILFNKDFVLHDRIIAACISTGFEPHITSEVSQWSFIAEMVASKMGVSLLPKSICKHLSKEVKAIRVANPSISWQLAIIWANNRYLSYAAKEWLKLTKELLTKRCL